MQKASSAMATCCVMDGRAEQWLFSSEQLKWMPDEMQAGTGADSA